VTLRLLTVAVLLCVVALVTPHADPEPRPVAPPIAPIALPDPHPTTTTTLRPATTLVEKPVANMPGNMPPSPPPAPAAAPGTVEAIITAEFGPVAPEAIRVARCESGLNPNARNGQFRGLYQIGAMHAAQWEAVTGADFWSTWMDPTLNARFARWLYGQSGSWAAWSCKP
jgi:hypothetical protein